MPRGPADIPQLVEMLRRPADQGRAAVKLTRLAAKQPEAAAAVAALLDDPDCGIRRVAAWTLEGMGTNAAGVAERAAARLNMEPDEHIRHALVRMLTRAAPPPVLIPAFMAACRDQNGEVRRGAVFGLGVLAVTETLPLSAVLALAAAMTDSDKFVRKFAAEALGRAGAEAEAKSAVSALTAALEDPFKPVRKAAKAALARAALAKISARCPLLPGAGSDQPTGLEPMLPKSRKPRKKPAG